MNARTLAAVTLAAAVGAFAGISVGLRYSAHPNTAITADG
jgi:branched-subunit amino acid ABC-type transport system permease component